MSDDEASKETKAAGAGIFILLCTIFFGGWGFVGSCVVVAIAYADEADEEEGEA